MDPDSNPAWPAPPGAIHVDPYNAADDHRRFTQSVELIDEDDPLDSARVVVEGKQFLDGRVERWCALYGINAGTQFTAAGCRRLAAFLMNAADGLDQHNRHEEA
jgi:hypothetical protein